MALLGRSSAGLGLFFGSFCLCWLALACQRRRQTRNLALRVRFWASFALQNRSFSHVCFARAILDARAKARLAKIDILSKRKPVFMGLRPRRRSRNEDNSGSKNYFKKRLKKQPKVCENDDLSGSGAELQKHRPKMPPRPSPGSGERPGRPKTAPRSAKSSAKTAPRGHQERLQR